MSKSKPVQVLRLLRPHHWIKNVTVYTGVVFGHGWDDLEKVVLATVAFIGFCLVSSTVYIFNDMVDREQDRLHPVRQYRPIASGALTLVTGGKLMLACGLVGMTLSLANTSLLTGELYTWCFSSYLALNIVYNAREGKDDLTSASIVASGFFLRLLVGTVGIGIANESLWLVIGGFSFALFLAIGKRNAADYGRSDLVPLLAFTAAGAVLSYGIYAVTAGLFLSILPVAYGTGRYLYLLLRKKATESVITDTIRDAHMSLAVVGWSMSIFIQA